MASSPQKHLLDRIRVQTARMLEVYSLLQCELERNRQLAISHEERLHLAQAIDTIAASMRQLQDYFARQQEDSSLPLPQNIDEILDAVLKWHMAGEK